MKIAIDGSGATFGGSATYMHNLLPNLARIDQENEYFIICTQDESKWTVDLPENFNYLRTKFFSLETKKRMFWMQFQMPKLIKEFGIDVIYSPNDITSFSAQCSIVLAIRNSNPYTDLDTTEGLRDKLHFKLLKQLTRISSWKASKIIFVSKYSKLVISEQLGIPDEKGFAIYHGLNDKFDVHNVLNSEFHNYRPYILSVSTIYRYKNYITLIKAFSKLIKKYDLFYNLLIAGRIWHKEYFEEMQRVVLDERISSRVHFLGEIDYAKMPSLYAGAKLFAFPSYLETFGHPLVEAMASGVPIVSSNASVMPEVCTDAALYFDPFNPDELAQVMYTVLTDDALYENMRKRCLKRAKEFSWEKTAIETLKILKSSC